MHCQVTSATRQVQVLDILGEEVPCVAYDTWIGYLPEGVFTFKADAEAYRAEIARVAGKVRTQTPCSPISDLRLTFPGASSGS